MNAVLPGMQSAFVDMGLPKTGFLHASDLAESLSALEDLSDADEDAITSLIASTTPWESRFTK